MPNFSVVIVCKNEVDIIERVIKSVCPLTDDIVVYDSGSTDGTLDILLRYNVRLYTGNWLGYGKTKQNAVKLAKYDWVLSIDADEALDSKLQQELKNMTFLKGVAYKIPFKNFLGEKHLRWGEWGRDNHIRLFNRTELNWNESVIHEQLVIPQGTKIKKLKGSILHFTAKDTVEYSEKVVRYALLNAQKYFDQGKKASLLKRLFAPGFSFSKHYIFQLGFLDGWEGYVSAYMTFFYTFLKYTRLHELWKLKNAERKI